MPVAQQCGDDLCPSFANGWVYLLWRTPHFCRHCVYGVQHDVGGNPSWVSGTRAESQLADYLHCHVHQRGTGTSFSLHTTTHIRIRVVFLWPHLHIFLLLFIYLLLPFFLTIWFGVGFISLLNLISALNLYTGRLSYNTISPYLFFPSFSLFFVSFTLVFP